MNALLLGKIRAMTDRVLADAINKTTSTGEWRAALLAEQDRRFEREMQKPLGVNCP